MKSTWHLIGRLRPQSRVTILIQRRAIVTLAIETSCDDTSVAILERKKNTARLHFHEKITSDNRQTQGIHPLTALESHQKSLAKLIQKSLLSLPAKGALNIKDANGVYHSKAKPDFVTVTRGPGMLSCLNTGLDTAKGLSVAWQVPLLGVNHMQAHALTPRLVSALENKGDDTLQPKFPYLTLLVSGGHTMFVHSHSIAEHEILATTGDIALGDMIDKCARDILPAEVLEAGDNVMYGRLLESFAFPDGEKAKEYAYSPSKSGQRHEYDWKLQPPLASEKSNGSKKRLMEYSFSGLGTSVKQIMERKPDMDLAERRVLAQETMRVAFEHLVSRLLIALEDNQADADWGRMTTVVASGGVASNQYLKHILKTTLQTVWPWRFKVNFPPPELCTDNAAMIAWTGTEMWALRDTKHGNDLGVLAVRKWPIHVRASELDVVTSAPAGESTEVEHTEIQDAEDLDEHEFAIQATSKPMSRRRRKKLRKVGAFIKKPSFRMVSILPGE